jgi:FAD/FMN-containing dehydrogenase
MTAIQPHSPVEILQRRLRGTVIEPGAPGWDEATQAFNTHFTQTPALLALPESARDVAAIVEFARGNGLQVAAQRTGHNAEPFGSEMDDLVLVKTDRLQGVQIDVQGRRARVASGTKWGQVVPQASELGLAALHGSTPDVSVTGYSLGGGVGWYARKLGLSTNSVLAIELVTADGRLRRVDHEHDAELFWALRGGGGNFGVVTAIEIQLYSIPEIYAGVLFFPWERSAEVLHAWNAWRTTVPDEVTSVGRILQFPPLPELPDALRGGKFAVVEAVYMGDEASGAEILEPLRALAPAMDTFAMVPPVGLAELHMDPPDPLPYTGEGMMLAELPSTAIDAFVAAAGPESGSPLVSAEIRHLGGALFRSSESHGALDTFDSEFLTFQLGLAFDGEMLEANRAQLRLLRRALTPYDSGRQYLNFTEERTDVSTFYKPDVFRRLQAVKTAVDPENVFRANHPIPSAG